MTKHDYEKRHFLKLATMAPIGCSLGEINKAQAEQPSRIGNQLRNPSTLYPRPPFINQEQDFPGIQSKMHPIPDCGENSYQGNAELVGRHALITGGDSGIGRAVAIAYAREGADIAINYLPQEESDAQEVCQLIRKAGRKVIAIPGDLRSEKFCRYLIKQSYAALGGIDILVNNAAFQAYSRDITQLTTERFDQTLKTNIYALFWLVKNAVPYMPKGSTIINTSSQQAYDPSDILVDYAMTKAGISSMTKSLAKQLLPHGIRVNAVNPGPFWTPLEVSGGQPEENVAKFGEETIYGRPGQPKEVADLYVMLASTRSSYVTGQNWGITGGDGVPG